MNTYRQTESRRDRQPGSKESPSAGRHVPWNPLSSSGGRDYRGRSLGKKVIDSDRNGGGTLDQALEFVKATFGSLIVMGRRMLSDPFLVLQGHCL